MGMYEDMTGNIRKEIAEYIVDNIENYEGTDTQDLHQNLFNTNYYIIGRYPAKEWLDKNDTFDCIELVRDYEQTNFGEVNTDFSDPERIVNMVAYIYGENLLTEVDGLEGTLTKGMITKVKRQLNGLIQL